MLEMYVQGVSTRRVKNITEELCGHEFSSATISRMVGQLDSELEKFAQRPLEEPYPYLVSLVMTSRSVPGEPSDDFTFLARQKGLRVATSGIEGICSFRRRLRCLILIDLKLGRFSHADVGQMNMYLSLCARALDPRRRESTVGLILCSERNDIVAHYALGNINNRVLAREYKLSLPEESVLIKKSRIPDTHYKSDPKRAERLGTSILKSIRRIFCLVSSKRSSPQRSLGSGYKPTVTIKAPARLQL